MLWWVLFTLVLLAVLTVLTIAWWRVGDRWAETEHKRFAPKRDDDADREPPRVVRLSDQPDQERDGG